MRQAGQGHAPGQRQAERPRPPKARGSAGACPIAGEARFSGEMAPGAVATEAKPARPASEQEVGLQQRDLADEIDRQVGLLVAVDVAIDEGHLLRRIEAELARLAAE
jgi:hypothetical protein